MTLTTHCNIYILRHTVTEETSNLKDLCLIIITITTIIITKVFFVLYIICFNCPQLPSRQTLPVCGSTVARSSRGVAHPHLDSYIRI